MTEIYYDKLEKVDAILDELVSLKDTMYKRLVAERNDAVNKALAEFQEKVIYLQARFDQSAERALAELGDTIPEEVRNKVKNDNSSDGTE